MVKRTLNKRLILLYHHVVHTLVDPWEMAVTPENFKDHLEVLANEYEVLPLSKLSHHEPNSSGTSVFLTFDDAYLDNYSEVFPALREAHLPGSFFVATQILNENPNFWWELLEELFLGYAAVPELLELKWPDGTRYRKRTGKLEMSTQPWSAWTDFPKTPRQEIYLELSSRIKEFPPDAQKGLSGQLLSWAGRDPSPGTLAAKMAPSQLTEVHRSGLVEIGSHSVHHPALAKLPPTIQIQEISESKRQLETLLQSPVIAFAYPHGHFDNITRSLVSKAGYKIACTTEEGSFDAGHDPMTLPRVWVKNWTKDRFVLELEKWVNSN